jgi:hypothetical protein
MKVVKNYIGYAMVSTGKINARYLNDNIEPLFTRMVSQFISYQNNNNISEEIGENNIHLYILANTGLKSIQKKISYLSVPRQMDEVYPIIGSYNYHSNLNLFYCNGNNDNEYFILRILYFIPEIELNDYQL